MLNSWDYLAPHGNLHQRKRKTSEKPWFGISLKIRKEEFVSIMGEAENILRVRIIPTFNPWNILSTWILCVVLSMISGFYPSWRASRLDPVEALRHE